MINIQEFRKADSILRIVENGSAIIGDSALRVECMYNRLSCFVYLNELDSATYLIENFDLDKEESTISLGNMEIMAMYYNSVKDYVKSESLIERVWKYNLSEDDTVYLYYVAIPESPPETVRTLNNISLIHNLNFSVSNILGQD